MTELMEYPAWLRIEHWLNVLFLTLVMRSGIEILSSHPKLYWHDDSAPGTEWARFTNKTMPKDKLYDTLDEEESYSPLVALPGHKMLGLGRHWHFASVMGWIAVGAVYYILLFATGQWRRYIPTSWWVFQQAWEDILTYLSFNLPPLIPGESHDAIQKLTYAAVLFILAPFQILTGAAQSPAVEARFPWFVRLWGGRQSARSLHFLGLTLFALFIIVHLAMVFFWGWGHLSGKIIFGESRDPYWATTLSMVIIASIILVHGAATVWSYRKPRSVQQILGAVVRQVRLGALRPLTSRQDYSSRELSHEHRVNGKPPTSTAYMVMAAHNFVDWRLEVGGLVERPITIDLPTLIGLRAKQSQRVLHNCVQGWSSIGEWGGLPLRDLVDMVQPLPDARYLCLLTMQDSGRDEPSADGTGQFYEIIDLQLSDDPQTLLAYEMNGEPLPIKHGAPLRLRVETQVGFKMAKWIDRIEFVADYSHIGHGMGGWREDNIYFDKDVEI